MFFHINLSGGTFVRQHLVHTICIKWREISGLGFFFYKYTWCLFISSRFWYQFAVQHCLSCTSHIFVWRAFKDASVRTIICDSFSYIFIFWQVSCTTGAFILFIYTIASRLVLAVYICLYSQTIDSHLSTFKLLFCKYFIAYERFI